MERANGRKSELNSEANSEVEFLDEAWSELWEDESYSGYDKTTERMPNDKAPHEES